MRKFLRNYLLTIQQSDGKYLDIAMPFTVQFDVVRNVLSSANTGSFQVKNLSQHHRYLIQKNINDYASQRFIYFRAGYGDEMPLIFAGTVTHAYSVREGADFTTYIEAFDGGFAFVNSRCNISFPAGTSREDMLRTIISTMPGISVGAIGGGLSGTIPRGNSYRGATSEILHDLTSGEFFVDLMRAYSLTEYEVLEPAGVSVINSGSGLLNTPERDQTNMRLDMIFEPKLRVGQVVTVESETERWMTGEYKVISLSHRGMISEAVCGDAVTTVGLFAPFLGFKFTHVKEEN